MVISSRWSTELPQCSIQKWIFGSSFGPLPDTPMYIDPERPDTHFLTVADYRLWSKRITLGLIRHGLKPGDRVLLFSGNSIFYPPVIMGVIMAGGIYSGANPNLVTRELAYQLRDSGALFLIAADKSLETALEAARQVGLPKSRIFAFDDTALDKTPAKPRLGVCHWTQLLAPKDDAATYDWVEPEDPKTATCLLNYSSGTTGLPKGVEITHQNYVANAVGIVTAWSDRDDFDAWLSRQVQLCHLPLYHAAAQACYAVNVAYFRTPVYIQAEFNFVKFLEYCAKYRVTALVSAPPIIISLVKHPLTKKFDLSSVEFIVCGTAPLSAEVSDQLLKLWPEGHMNIQQIWGMTELTCTPIGWQPSERNPCSGASIGEVLPNNSARLVDPVTGKEITEANVPGELWMAGPALMKRYWNRPDETAATLHVEGNTRWLKTGDLVYVDKYGPGAHFFVIDRLKELIKVKGNQVAPAELEGVLLKNEAVADAAVVGVTIDGGEVPRAYIVLNPAAVGKVSEQDIADWMADKVIRFKRLKGGVKFIEQIPKNPSGKILRKVLREQAAKEVGDSKPHPGRKSGVTARL